MRCFVALGLALAAAAPAQDYETCTSVPVYEPCEIRLELSTAEAAEHPNPYSSITLRAEFRSPKGGRTKVMPAFWDGGRRFVLRFSPDYEGRWDFRIISNLGRLDKQTGSFQALAARTPGFIEVFNTRYFKYPLTNTAHFWLGDSMLELGIVPWETFRAVVEKRAEQKFTHLRALVLGPPDTAVQVFKSPEEPWIEYFRELDRRVAYLHGLGFVTDLVLGGAAGELEKLFPRLRQRDRYIRYVCARYASYSVTWQGVLEWESYTSAAKLLEQLAASLDKYDPYSHPKATGAAVTSTALAADEWQDYFIQNRVARALASIEYETQLAPFVNTGVGIDADADTARKQAWTVASRGHNISLSSGGRLADPPSPDSPAAHQIALLGDFFAQTRYFDLQPHYRVVGGSALALQRVPYRAENLIGIEYIVYAEDPGLIELVIPKHEYSVSWYNPTDGAWLDQKKKFKATVSALGPQMTVTTGCSMCAAKARRRATTNRSFWNRRRSASAMSNTRRRSCHSRSSFRTQANSKPAASTSSMRLFKKNTIAAKRMLWLWTVEVAGSGRGRRILGSTQSGTFLVPDGIAGSYPATLSVRLTGLDGAGRLFEAFRPYALRSPGQP